MFYIGKLLALKNVTVYVGAVIILILYSFAYLTTHQEDLRIYLQASEAIKVGQNIYTATSNQYVYGPFLALFLIPLTFFEGDTAKMIWGFVNLFSVFAIAFLINKLRLKKSRNEILYPSLLVFFLSSFSFRNNLGQGQAVTLVVISWLCVVLLSKSQINVGLKYFTISLLTISILEIKPYLGIGLLFYLMITMNFKFHFIFGLTLFSIQMLYQKYLAVNYLTWLNALKHRSETVIDGNDQASLPTLLRVNFGVGNSFVIIAFFIFLILIFLFLLRRRRFLINELESITMIIPLVISPFMHAHDLLLGLAGLALLVDFTKKFTCAQLALLVSILVLHVGWTSDIFIGGVLILGLLSFALFVGVNDLKVSSATFLFTLGFAQLMILQFAFSLSDYSRIRAYNFLALLEGTMLLLLVCSKPGLRKNEMSDLSLPRDNIGLDS